jgi:diaminohydroxyphosphoribosylaminopyrimidine deaminase/5-amino-6-(5-phosphoribosylamino)uracil reductase
LLEAGISRVVFATDDPNPRVNGGGMERLLEAGVRVEKGLMAQQARDLNPGFLSRMKTGRPWIRIKTAISLDGRTGLSNGDSKWISSKESRRDVQCWRARASALLTGIGTVLADDPMMNARVDGSVKQPHRVILDSAWRTPPHSRILADPETALIAGDRDAAIPGELLSSEVECLPLAAAGSGVDLQLLMAALAEKEFNEVQVEAGARLCGALLREELVDELLIYQAPVLLGEGGPGSFAIGPLESMDDRTHFSVLETTHVGDDLRIRLAPIFRNQG